MGVIGLVIKRARAGLGLLLTILSLAAGTTAIIAGTLGYSEAAATTAARQALSSAQPTEAGIRVQTRLADDPAAQEAQAQQIIRAAFAPTDVLIQRTIVSEPRGVTGQSGRLIVMAGPALTTEGEGFAERIEVTEGTWPTSGASGTGGDAGQAVQGALHAGTAELWDVAVGDQLDVSGTAVEVTALWRPVDTNDAFWFGNPLIESGSADGTAGPLVVSEAATGSFGSTPFVQFTVQPDAERVLPSDMPRLAAVAGALDTSLRTPGVEVRGVTVEGDLAPTAAAAARNLATARALNLVPVTLLLLVSLIAIVQIARLQAQARAGEVEVLIARGASRGQVLWWSVLEAVVVAVVSAALGTAAALGVMQLVPAGDLQSGLVVRTGLLAGLAILLALVAVAVLQVRTLANQSATDRSGRTRTVAALGTVVLTVGAAAIAWWQLDRYGSPLVTDADGSLRTDLVAGAAPALLLAAAAVLATMVLGPVGRFVEALSRRSRGLLTHLVSAQVSRRIVVYAVPVVLTVLAVGATTVSGLYAGTSAQLREGIAALGRGADVRAVVASAPVSSTTLPAVPTLAGSPGVDASTPVWLSQGRLGNNVVSYTTLPVDQLGQAVSVPDGVLDVPVVVEALRSPVRPQAPIALPATATALDLTLDLRLELDREELQASVDDTWDMAHEALAEGAVEDPPPPEQVEAIAVTWVEDLIRAYAGEQDLSVVLWFWDEPSQSLLRVEAPTMSMAFEATVSDPATSRQVSVSPTTMTDTVRLPIEAGPGRHLVGIDLGLVQGPIYDFDLTITELTTSGEGDAGTNLITDGAFANWITPVPEDGPGDEAPATPTTGTLTADARGLVVVGTTGRERLLQAIVPLRDPGLVQVGGAVLTGDRDDGVAAGEAGDVPSADPATGEDVTTADPSALPIAMTAALAATGNFQVGSPLTIQAYGTTMPARVAAIVTAVPGSTTPHGVLIDSSALSTHLATVGETLGAPSQLWASASDIDAAVAAAQDLPGIAAVTGPGSVSVTDAASAVRLVFWVASAGAVLLAVTGIAAVAANLLRVRRAEVSVLRALGMTPGGQARTRAAELFSVILASVGLGLLAGWLVGWLVVPELARSTTLAGQAQLSAPLVLEVPLWAGLLIGLIAALLLLLVVLHATVRRQALDNEYREEIR